MREKRKMTNFTENRPGIELGYACINLTLQQDKKNKITCNRSMIKRTFQAKGIEYASELAELNTGNILPILEWNHRNDIRVFRMTSCLFPWASEYMLEDLPGFDKISHNLKVAGDYAKELAVTAATVLLCIKNAANAWLVMSMGTHQNALGTPDA